MKRILIFTVAVLTYLLPGSAAIAKIKGSHHDLSGSNSAHSSYTWKDGHGPSACEFCHVPHNAGKGNLPDENGNILRGVLWNRKIPTGFTAYGATVSSDTIAGSGTVIANSSDLGMNSLTCLSCHDGVTALSTLTSYNYWGNTDAANSGNWMTGMTTLIKPDSWALIGKNLRDDHPVGFPVVDGRAGVPLSAFKGNAGTGTGMSEPGQNSTGISYKFWLYEGKFECASCHDPHDTTTGATGKSGVNGESPDSSKRGGSAFFLRAPISSICTDCHQDK